MSNAPIRREFETGEYAAEKIKWFGSWNAARRRDRILCGHVFLVV